MNITKYYTINLTTYLSIDNEAKALSLPDGTLLKEGTYKIIGLIHTDEFCHTYEATHLGLNKRVIIKEFFPKELCDRETDTLNLNFWSQRLFPIFENFKYKFVEEATSLAKLSHPGIVKINDVFMENGTAYYEMDYINGSSLEDTITRKGKLDEEETLSYIKQVSLALDFVHKKGRLHLDINPSNIIIDGFNQAVLINFESYKRFQPYYDVIEDDSEPSWVEPSGYVPLELYANDLSKIGPQTDIYALGATFYKCLTGKTPLSPERQLHMGKKLDPIPSYVSVATIKTIKAAMELSHKNRPQTIGEFLSILNQMPLLSTEKEETIKDERYYDVEYDSDLTTDPPEIIPIDEDNISSQPNQKTEEAEDEIMLLKNGYLLQGGKYKIVRFIARGGFGCTYEAEHVMLAKKVAIKEFFPKKFCDRDIDTLKVTAGTESLKPLISKLKLKFIDEARSLVKLSHPCIVKVSDIFEENGTAYYVMDYIEGNSLSKIIKEKGSLSEKETMGYIRQICDSLDYVHSQNCLHLDIKPGNIMIDGTGRAVLIDFGAAKQYDEENGENTSTLLGKTPGFAPIEQMGNDVQYFKPATDIYALGATIYKCITGKTPLEVTRLANGEELDPLPSNVTQSTRDAIDAAMEISSKKRPQTIKEFVAILDKGRVNRNQNGNRSIWSKWFGKK